LAIPEAPRLEAVDGAEPGLLARVEPEKLRPEAVVPAVPAVVVELCVAVKPWLPEPECVVLPLWLATIPLWL
jgi:hypothetical protein